MLLLGDGNAIDLRREFIMHRSRKREANDDDGGKKARVSYVPPSVVYEGKLTIRAGSPVPTGGNPFDGPPYPFSPPGG